MKPLALAIASLGVCSISLAAFAEAPTEKIEITGSRIKRVDDEGAAPVQVISKADITKTGATTVRELIDTISGSTSSLSDAGGSTSFAGGASSASLRNMGKQSTLVLVNFRRIAAYPLADFNETFTNIDSIPFEAIERVEILKNGGSAIYGSDAVAGVINIVTKKSFEGVAGHASYQQDANTSKFVEKNASLTAGFGNLQDDGYNILANFEAFKRDGVDSWRDLLDHVNPAYKDPDLFPSFGTGSTYSYPGNINGKAIAGCTTVNAAGQCIYDRYQRFQAQPSSERQNLLVSGTYKLGGELEGFSEFLYSHITTDYQNAYATYGSAASPSFWANATTGERQTFRYYKLPATHPLNTTGADASWSYRFADAPSEKEVETDQYRVLTGLRGVVHGWDWESALGVMGGKTTDSRRGAISVSGFNDVIGQSSDADFFNKTNGYKIGKANSADVLNKLFPSFGYTAKNSNVFFDGKINGEWGSIGGRPINVATGFDAHHERMEINPTDKLANGDMVGYGVSTVDASRSYGAIFSEVNLPVLKQLEVQAAARVDKYEGFDPHFSPKIGFRYSPTKKLLFRGTFETGFRAPNLTESAPSRKVSFASVADPKRCPAAIQYAKDLRAEAAALPNTDPEKAQKLAKADIVRQNECSGVMNVTSNNPDLKPETSKSFTIGFAFEPIPGWSTTVDYWAITRKDEIGVRSTSEVLASEDTQAPNVVNRSKDLANDPTFSVDDQKTYGVTTGALESIKLQFENISKTRTSGIDWAVKGSQATPIGRLGWDLDAVYTLKYQEYSPSRGDWGDNLVGRYGYSRWVLGNTVSLKNGSFTNSIRYTWNSGYTLQRDYNDSSWTTEGCADYGLSQGQCRVGNYERFDYNVAYTGVKNLTINFNIRNIFDQRPPVDYRDYLENNSGIIPSSISDVQGRVFKLSLDYRFK
ncbi:TonB-dependent receptor [Niveibacterium terrae]|uniref:TonB-dependent receptor n=1 Tax=Niveibacterium terrae TaxID=3373598 RepID=UPI003A8E29D5